MRALAEAEIVRLYFVGRYPEDLIRSRPDNVIFSCWASGRRDLRMNDSTALIPNHSLARSTVVSGTAASWLAAVLSIPTTLQRAGTWMSLLCSSCTRARAISSLAHTNPSGNNAHPRLLNLSDPCSDQMPYLFGDQVIAASESLPYGTVHFFNCSPAWGS